MNHILATTTAPASVTPKMATAAGIAENLATALDLVGLLAVELFAPAMDAYCSMKSHPDPQLWALTRDGSYRPVRAVVRAVAAFRGDPSVVTPTVMKNLIGDVVEGWADYLTELCGCTSMANTRCTAVR